MNKLLLNICILSTVALVACSPAEGDGRKTADTNSQDTTAIFEADIEEEKEPEFDLSTTEGQLEMMKNSEDWTKYESGILVQMAQDVPDYSRKILENDGKRFIIVDKAKMKLFLYDQFGNVEKSYGIACAKNYGTKQKKGDSRTTEGIFNVKGVFDSTNWLFTDDNGYTSPTKGQYGPRFIRLDIPYIGIHGTGSPGSIGRRCSHGCIRVTNANILELVEFVEEGMKVIISPGPKDMAVNQHEGSPIPSVVTEVGTERAVPGKMPYNNTAADNNKKSVETQENAEDNGAESGVSAEPAASEGHAAPAEEPSSQKATSTGENSSEEQ